MQLLKNVPNLQVVYIGSNQVNDAALGPLKDLAGLSALTIMSPQVTDAALENLKNLSGLTMLFLTSSKVSDRGLVQLNGLNNLQVLALSRTEVTDAGLDALKSLKSIYLIGTKVTPQAIDKLKGNAGRGCLQIWAVVSQDEDPASCLALPSSSSTIHACGGATGFCVVVPNSPQRQISTPAKPIGMPRGSPTIGTLSKSPIITRIRPAITANRWLAILLPVSVS